MRGINCQILAAQAVLDRGGLWTRSGGRAREVNHRRTPAKFIRAIHMDALRLLRDRVDGPARPSTPRRLRLARHGPRAQRSGAAVRARPDAPVRGAPGAVAAGGAVAARLREQPEPPVYVLRARPPADLGGHDADQSLSDLGGVPVLAALADGAVGG